MEKLSDLPNIGKELEKQLQQIGITTKEELEKIGSQEAWLKIQLQDPSACIHRLMALEGAIQRKKKTELSETDKKQLKQFYQKHKI